MKRLVRYILFVLCALMCASCTALPAEERAFAVVLGVDRQEGTWQVSARIPTYRTDGGYTTLEAEGKTLPMALASLDAASPSKLHLDQLRLLVVSRDLAGDEAFPAAMATLAMRHDLRMQSAVAVTQGDVRDLVDKMEPEAGSRLSKSIDVLLETRIAQGAIPEGTLADMLHMGERQTPLLANIRLEEKRAVLLGGWAVDTDGRVTGEALTDAQMQLIALMQGRLKQTALRLPDASFRVMDASAKPTLTDGASAIRLTVRATESDQTAQALQSAIAGECLTLLNRLTNQGCDVLGLGRQAIRRVPDMASWHALDWPGTLPTIRWTVQVGVRGPSGG